MISHQKDQYTKPSLLLRLGQYRISLGTPTNRTKCRYCPNLDRNRKKHLYHHGENIYMQKNLVYDITCHICKNSMWEKTKEPFVSVSKALCKHKQALQNPDTKSQVNSNAHKHQLQGNTIGLHFANATNKSTIYFEIYRSWISSPSPKTVGELWK